MLGNASSESISLCDKTEIITLNKSKMRKNGFTLIELLVVIVIITILASVAYPVFISVQERARAAQDMSNLRQIGLATQMYMNDNDGTIFSTTGTWMSQLEPKYIPAWKIFQSPFDKRSPLEDNANSPVSYGLNNATGMPGVLSDKINNPSAFILFAPAQDAKTTVDFTGKSGTAVTVLQGSGSEGNPPGGTHSNRTRINAVFADMHTETLPWTTFISDSADAGAKCSGGNAPNGSYRWHVDPCVGP